MNYICRKIGANAGQYHMLIINAAAAARMGGLVADTGFCFCIM